MTDLADRRYSISEVSELTGVAIHVLRQWEKSSPHLRPKRDRNNRRYYMPADIEDVRTLKRLRRQEGMTGDGADRYLRLKKRIGDDIHSPQRAQALVDKIESEVRGILRLLR
jgi:DNA-binding transcriptional MerR regulator